MLKKDKIGWSIFIFVELLLVCLLTFANNGVILGVSLTSFIGINLILLLDINATKDFGFDFMKSVSHFNQLKTIEKIRIVLNYPDYNNVSILRPFSDFDLPVSLTTNSYLPFFNFKNKKEMMIFHKELINNKKVVSNLVQAEVKLKSDKFNNSSDKIKVEIVTKLLCESTSEVLKELEIKGFNIYLYPSRNAFYRMSSYKAKDICKEFKQLPDSKQLEIAKYSINMIDYDYLTSYSFESKYVKLLEETVKNTDYYSNADDFLSENID